MEQFYKYISQNREEFINKVIQISSLLKIDPVWLLSVMLAESGLNPQAKNPVGGAVGLIQFMPVTAQGLGTTSEALLHMNNVQQLDYVYLYFKPYAGKMHSVYDLYLVTFFPAALGKEDNYILQTNKLSAGLIAQQNPGIDLNKDGKITVGEFKKYVSRYLKKKTLN